MDVSKIRPLRGWVFLEALAVEMTKSGLFIPADRYPEIGRVLAVGRSEEDILPGDLCVVPNEGTHQGNTYWQVCFLVLKDWPERVLCDVEIEPVIRETVSEYRRNPSSGDKKILVEPLEGDKISFDCSDVLEYGIEELSNPGISLDYIPAVRLHFWTDGLERLYYFIREDEVLLTLRDNDVRI